MLPLESRINAAKMRALCKIYALRLVDCVRNSKVTERLGLKYIIEVKMQKHVMLRWFGCVERMTIKRLTDRYTIRM